MPDRTTARLIGFAATTPEHFLLMQHPADATRPAVRYGATHQARWQPEPNRSAGGRELAWFEKHQHELTSYENQWIAVVGDQIAATGASFADVRAFLNAHSLPNALIVYVRENVNERQLFID